MLKSLTRKLKAKGLSITEDAVAEVVKEIFIKIKEQGISEMIDALEVKVMAAVDKIDGEDDPGR